MARTEDQDREVSAPQTQGFADYQIQVPDEDLDGLADWLQEEIFRAQSERSGLEDMIIEYDRLYEAKPRQEKKDFPWPGASNITVPVVATAVDAVLARLLNAVFGADELWVGVPKSAHWAEIAKPVGDFLNWAGENVLDMYKTSQRWFLSTIKSGTGVVKVVWEHREKNIRYMDSNGAMINETVTTHNGPKIYNIPIDQFYFSSDALSSFDLQQCEWIGHPTYYTWKELNELEQSGIFTNIDEIKEHPRTYATEREQETEENTGVEPMQRGDYEVVEVWCSYTLEGDSVPSELVVSIHPQTRTILRAVYNFYRHQERPFHLVRYMPRDNSLLGIGIPEMLQDVQEEVTTLHNQRVDNGTLANTNVFLRRKGSGVNVEEVYPGQIIDVEEMDHFQPTPLGQPHNSLLVEEQHTNAIGEKRTGVSDYTVGRESSAIGSNATATSTMALIREGNKRFQMTIRDIREAISSIGHQVLMLYQQFAPNRKVMYEMFEQEEARMIEEYLDLPSDLTRKNIHLDIPALSETTNKEMTQQTMMSMLQVTRDFYTSMFDAVSVAINPQAPPEIQELGKHASKAGAEIFERLLQAFDFRDASTFKPDMEKILNLQQGLEQMNQSMGQSEQRREAAKAPNGLQDLAGGQDGPGANGAREGAAQGAQVGGGQPSMEDTARRIEEQILAASGGGAPGPNNIQR